MCAAAAPLLDPREGTLAGDQRLVLHNVPWKTYVVLRELLDSPGLRMTYLEGALELMSPSGPHESMKKMIARLIEIWALERDVPLYGYGSTTFRREAAERGLEPDECYCLGHELGDAPDLAIEVVLTSGGVSKLAVYAGLGVGEVWFWQDGSFRTFFLGPAGFDEIATSRLLPELDLAQLATFVTRPDQPAAVREYRDLVRPSR
jgi:Uma2 family endonuclease